MFLLYLSASLLIAGAQAVSDAKPSPIAPPQTQAAAQPGSADVKTPTDPKARIELARKMNGLEGFNIQPWHLKASYELFDTEGNSKTKGMFEEWWISQKRYKFSYQSPGFSQDFYGTDHGIFRAGDPEPPLVPLGLLQPIILRPVDAIGLNPASLRNTERQFKSAKLSCTVSGKPGLNYPEQDLPGVCFAPTNAVLIYANSNNRVFQTLFEHILLFRDRYVARDVHIFLLGRPSLTIHIDILEALNPSDPSASSVPAGAVLTPSSTESAGTVVAGSLITKVAPQYPASAKLMGIQGTVILEVKIATNGHIRRLEVLSGPQALQQPALDAVRQWVYKPFLKNGEPVEVETQINVVFNLGR